MRPKRAILAVAAVLGALVVVWLAFSGLRSRNKLIVGRDFEGVIFSHRAAERTLGSMLVNDPSGYWTPTREQVLGSEGRLVPYVQRTSPHLEPPLPEYTRQYFGFTRGGTQRILIIGFCRVEDLDWKNEFVSAAESRDCRFEAEYDAATDELSYFWTLSD